MDCDFGWVSPGRQGGSVSNRHRQRGVYRLRSV